MKIFSTVAEFKNWRRQLSGTVGFAPTMGALHQGHLELLRQSRESCDHTILSIFVNPTQFNNPEDFKKYPQTLEADLQVAQDAKIQAVFLPQFADIYPHGYKYKISENDFSNILCGAARPGHFDGVLTVVMKLFQIIQADKAFFGEKDHQQLQLVRQMAEDFFLSTQVIGVPTMREASGLAMSSRNKRLSATDLDKASLIYKTISKASDTLTAKKQLTESGFVVDYLEDIQGRRYVAAFLHDVRLIDNVLLAQLASSTPHRDLN
ncbi:MAG: pantoate--beta-alanine ligase [Pseudobdellovibrionaceae bacterium]